MKLGSGCNWLESSSWQVSSKSGGAAVPVHSCPTDPLLGGGGELFLGIRSARSIYGEFQLSGTPCPVCGCGKVFTSSISARGATRASSSTLHTHAPSAAPIAVALAALRRHAVVPLLSRTYIERVTSRKRKNHFGNRCEG